MNRFSKFLCLSCSKFPEFFANCTSRSWQKSKLPSVNSFTGHPVSYCCARSCVYYELIAVSALFNTVTAPVIRINKYIKWYPHPYDTHLWWPTPAITRLLCFQSPSHCARGPYYPLSCRSKWGSVVAAAPSVVVFGYDGTEHGWLLPWTVAPQSTHTQPSPDSWPWSFRHFWAITFLVSIILE